MREADAGFALGHCLFGYVMMLAYSRAALAPAADALRAAERHAAGATPREQAHVRALASWIGGDIDRALRQWEAVLAQFPRDVLALRLAHANYFWLGRGDDMRASLERVAPRWGESTPGFMACLRLRARRKRRVSPQRNAMGAARSSSTRPKCGARMPWRTSSRCSAALTKASPG